MSDRMINLCVELRKVIIVRELKDLKAITNAKESVVYFTKLLSEFKEMIENTKVDSPEKRFGNKTIAKYDKFVEDLEVSMKEQETRINQN